VAAKAKEQQLSTLRQNANIVPKKSWERIEKEEVEKIKDEHYSRDAEAYLIATKKQQIARERRNEQRSKETHIYFMRIDDKMKVGSSYDVDTRLKQLKIASPTITLVGDVLFGEGARTHENALKKKFAEFLIDGEVYRYSDNLLQRMIAYTKREAKRANETDSIIAKAAGVSHDTIAKVEKIQAKATPEIKEAVKFGEMSINQAYKAIRKAEKKAERQELIKEQIEKPKTSAHVDIFTTDKKYRVVYADPPWQYNDKQDTSKLGGAEKKYPTMPLKDICALPVPTEDNAVLFLWVTSPMLEDAFKVIHAWGFSYKSSFIWDKVAHNMGHYNSVRHEFLLICTKGSCTPDVPKLLDSVVSIERTEHSVKPKEFRDMIDMLYPIGERLEMFAREASLGWDAWGNMV
jgi:N6-adenosine-specific RNA methylase IME4